MHDLNLPPVPVEGMRWRIVKDSIGSPCLRLERKGRWFWHRVEQEYISLWHTGDFAMRVRHTAYTILKERGNTDKIPYGVVK